MHSMPWGALRHSHNIVLLNLVVEKSASPTELGLELPMMRKICYKKSNNHQSQHKTKVQVKSDRASDNSSQAESTEDHTMRITLG